MYTCIIVIDTILRVFINVIEFYNYITIERVYCFVVIIKAFFVVIVFKRILELAIYVLGRIYIYISYFRYHANCATGR